MARQTRQQRRARRQEQGQAQSTTAQSTAVQRARARQQQVRPAAEAPTSPAGARRIPGSGGRRFVSESWAELKKVEWPGQPQLIQGTAVVLIACVIVGTYLWLADLAFKRLVEHVFLGQ